MGSLLNVAFLRPDGKKALIVFNEGNSAETFNLKYRDGFTPVKIEAK